MKKPYYLTTPIYYVNDVPHIGTSYTTTLADVVARYRRAFGEEVFFLTGTDEHGQKVQEAAAKRGVDPKAHCDELQQRFRDAWARLGIEPSDFIRTTETRHVRVVQAVLSDLHARGEFYKADYEGWYDVSAEIFVTETEIEGAGLDRSTLKRVSEKNWFFRMGKYRDRIREAVETDALTIAPAHRKNEVLGFLKKDLGDLCISRPKARLSWGIPLPFDPDYVTYVWFDALLNYVSAPGVEVDPAAAPGAPRLRVKSPWPCDLHLMGKDILTTHSIYWPAMLLAAGIPLPRKLLAHGWWMSGGKKMSKSLGNVIHPVDYVDRYGADALRYFLMREMVVGQDADFTEDRFKARYEGDLGNAWGNLLSRAMTMIGRYSEGRIPAGEKAPAGSLVADWAKTALERLPGWLDGVEIHEIASHAMDLFRAANGLAEREQPWKAAKDPAKAGAVRDVLYVLAEAVRAGSALLAPILPVKSADALRQLGAPPAGDLRSHLAFGVLKSGTPIAPGAILFPRLEPTPAT